MMLATSDMILSSQVNMSLASAYRDNVKAEYMAKSGMSAGLLLLASDLAYDLFQAQQDPKATLSDGFGDFWTALNGLPIGGETAEMMGEFQKQFDLNAVLDSGVMDQLKLFDGVFTLDVGDESQKINVNYCTSSQCPQTRNMLRNLFSCPAEKSFLEQKKLTAEELIGRIKDWVDTESRADEGSGYNDENDPYSKRVPKVEAKNAPFDTPDELREVEGWDEEVHAVFSKYLTIFPLEQSNNSGKGFQINLNTASRELLQCLFPESKGDCAEKSVLALKKRDADKANRGAAGQKVGEVLAETLCYNKGDTTATDSGSKESWFQQYSLVYRIEVDGTVGSSNKHLTAVVERMMPDPKKGEKSTYKILYMKIL
jgi:type II secretory pathway component PulK